MQNVRVLTLPYLEFEYCNVYRGTFGKTLPVTHLHPDAVVILWNPNNVFFVTIAQLLPCLQDMKADHWSMIVFWNEAKGSAARRGPDVGLDFTDQPAPAPEVPQPPANDDDGDYQGYEDPHADMPVDDEDMPPQSQQPEPDLDDDPILSSLVQVTILLLLLPEAAPLCRYRRTTVRTWICLTIRETEVIHQEAVP